LPEGPGWYLAHESFLTELKEGWGTCERTPWAAWLWQDGPRQAGGLGGECMSSIRCEYPSPRSGLTRRSSAPSSRNLGTVISCVSSSRSADPLIEAKLPKASARSIVFRSPANKGADLVLDVDRRGHDPRLAALSSPFHNGEVTIVEGPVRVAQPRNTTSSFGSASLFGRAAQAGRALPRSWC